MAKLKAKTRNALPASAFALPSKRKYPIKKLVKGKLVPDRRHAANAKARETQMVAKGKLSGSEAAEIRRKATRMLGE